MTVDSSDDVQKAFDRGARRYNRMIALNPGYFRHLRSAAAELMRRIGERGQGVKVLDLACGSGASTRALCRAAEVAPTIVGIDFSEGMLDQARRRVWPDSVSFAYGRAGRLDRTRWADGDHQGIFAAYLLRNIAPGERDAALNEIHDLLKPGGWFVTQEYSLSGRRAGWVWSVVCWLIIIPLGIVVDLNPSLYRYLWQSVRRFDSPGQLRQRLMRAGFVDVASRTVPGWQRGILHTFVAKREAA